MFFGLFGKKAEKSDDVALGGTQAMPTMNEADGGMGSEPVAPVSEPQSSEDEETPMGV